MLDADTLTTDRQGRAQPARDRFATWLAEPQPIALPKSGFGQAVHCAVNPWPTLVRYLGDGRLSLDNGPVERATRRLAVGRGNWVFTSGERGLPSAAFRLRVTTSAKRQGVTPWHYLQSVPTHLPHRPPNVNIAALRPGRWHPD